MRLLIATLVLFAITASATETMKDRIDHWTPPPPTLATAQWMEKLSQDELELFAWRLTKVAVDRCRKAGYPENTGELEICATDGVKDYFYTVLQAMADDLRRQKHTTNRQCMMLPDGTKKCF